MAIQTIQKLVSFYKGLHVRKIQLASLYKGLQVRKLGKFFAFFIYKRNI